MLKPTPRHPHGQRGEQQGGGDQHDAPGPRSLPKQEAAPAQDQAAQSQTSPGPAEGSGVPGPQPTSASQPQECGRQRDKTPSPPKKNNKQQNLCPGRCEGEPRSPGWGGWGGSCSPEGVPLALMPRGSRDGPSVRGCGVGRRCTCPGGTWRRGSRARCRG